MGRNGYDVRLGPDLPVALEFQLVHGDMSGIVLDFDEQVVVIDAVVLIEVRRSAGDGIGVGTATAGNEIGDPTVFVALVIMDMAVEHNNARSDVLLQFLQLLPQGLFGAARGVATAKSLFVGRTGVAR